MNKTPQSKKLANVDLRDKVKSLNIAYLRLVELVRLIVLEAKVTTTQFVTVPNMSKTAGHVGYS